MKTILSILLLPIMIFAQPMPRHQEQFNIELSMNVDIESILRNQIAMLENPDDNLEMFITVEIFFEELEVGPSKPQFTPYEMVGNTLPKFLNTYSLIGFPTTTKENLKPQERINHLIASNDPMYPKEDTMLNWLQPVRYQQNKLVGAARIPEGFGPRIRL